MMVSEVAATMEGDASYERLRPNEYSYEDVSANILA
jgi:hypothetical protein